MGKSEYKLFKFSIMKLENCVFSRRNGMRGKIVLGHSITIRLFGITII